MVIDAATECRRREYCGRGNALWARHRHESDRVLVTNQHGDRVLDYRRKPTFA